MLQHPVLGVGPNNFGAAEGTLSPLADASAVRRRRAMERRAQQLLQAGAELGLPGLLLHRRHRERFQRVAAALAPVRRRRSTSARPQLAQALTASLIGFVVGAFFLSLAYSEMLYTLVALAVGSDKVTALREQSRDSVMDVRGLRVAHLIESDGPGGAERMVAQLAAALQAAGARNVAFLPATARAGSRVSWKVPASRSNTSGCPGRSRPRPHDG